MKLQKLYRVLETRDMKINAEDRTIEFPFSSDRPVPRFFGDEILSHDSGTVNLERAKLGAMPLLFNHNMDDLRGIIEGVSMGDDNRLWAKARFAKTPAGDEALALVKDGMLPNVSFGYMIDEIEMTKSGDDTTPEWTVRKFTPFEISLVTIPADPTVGIGRSATNEEYEVKVIEKPKAVVTEVTAQKTISKEEIKIMEPNIEQEKKDAVAQERKRTTEVLAMGERFGLQDLARQLLQGELALDACREAFLDKIAVRKVTITGREADIGLSEGEVQNFSFIKAIRALSNPTNNKFREDAKFEFEVSAAAAAKRGKDTDGIFVPYEILRAKRSLSKGTPSAGGYLVATEHRPDLFIEMLRKKSALDRAGVTRLEGLVGDISIPSQTGGATAYFLAEAADVTDSQQIFGQVAMSPKGIGAKTDISRKLMLQSSPDVEQLVQSDLAKVLALAIDYAGMYGIGSASQPLGIVNTPSIKGQDFATASNPLFTELVGMESKIAADDADVEKMSYIVTAAMRGYLKSTLKFPDSSGDATLWEPGGSINGYNAVVSNQLVAGDVLFGNFADCIMGFWSGIDLNIDKSALALSGGTRLIIMQDFDVAVRHASSFCLGNDAQ